MSVRAASPVDPVTGRADRDGWKRDSVKGNLVSARRKYVETRWGTNGVEQVRAVLTGEAADLFEGGVLPSAWYPFPAVVAIDRAIIEGPFGGVVSEMKSFGAAVARQDLPGLYKLLFKLGTPSFIARRVGVVFKMYVRGSGEVQPIEATDTQASMALRGGAVPLYFCTYGMSGWFSAGLELSGARNVDVRETTCVHRGDAECRWDARWT